MPIRDFAPLDSEGIRGDRPPHEVKWAKLTNVNFRNGSIVPRVGFREWQDFNNAWPTSNYAPSNGLFEVYNPGSSTTGRGGNYWSTENLNPDGSALITGTWTATGASFHADLDAADGNDTFTTDTGAQFYVTFGNPVAAYSEPAGVRILFRARMHQTNGDSDGQIKVYQRHSSTGALTELTTVTVRAFKEAESEWFYNFHFLMDRDYSNNRGWADSDLDNLQIAFEFVGGTTEASVRLLPDALTTTTNWEDASDAGTPVVGDITVTRDPDDLSETYPSHFHALGLGTTNQIKTTTLSSLLEGTIENIDTSVTFTSIANVKLITRITIPPYSDTDINLEVNSTSALTQTIGGDCKPYSAPVIATMTVDPSDSGAWTQAKVNALTWGIQMTRGTEATVEYAYIEVNGVVSGAGVALDQVQAEVLGYGDAKPEPIVATNKGMSRINITSLTDVTNSVASSSVPSIVPFEGAQLYGQIYMVNGVDPTKRYPNGSSVFESLSTNNGADSAALTGRTVEAFADRILYGWISDGGTVTPERVEYSREFNGGDHSDNSAGNFDIIDTPGGIVSLKKLNESTCFCGKELGIYALRRTGNSRAPIIVDPIDYETRCVSRPSVQRVVISGQPQVLFLGWNPTTGYGIFGFDGERVQNLGGPVSKFIEEDSNARVIEQAIGGIEPFSGSYVIFLAEEKSLERDKAFAMNLSTGSWSRWEMPLGVYATDIWQTPKITDLGERNTGYYNEPGLVIGNKTEIPLQAHNLPYDSLTPPQGASSQSYEQLLGKLTVNSFSSTSVLPTLRTNFTSTIETGDIQLIDENAGELQTYTHRLHLDYTNYGPVRITASASTDGGDTWNSDTERFIGDLSLSLKREHTFIDLETNEHARMIRFRIKVEPDDAQGDFPYFWQIDRLMIQYEVGAIDGA